MMEESSKADNITGKILLSYNEYKRLIKCAQDLVQLKLEFEKYKESHSKHNYSEAHQMQGQGHQGLDGDVEHNDYSLPLPLPVEESVTPVTSLPSSLVKSNPFDTKSDKSKQPEFKSEPSSEAKWYFLGLN
jgi:hypothetical protein